MAEPEAVELLELMPQALVVLHLGQRLFCMCYLLSSSSNREFSLLTLRALQSSLLSRPARDYLLHVTLRQRSQLEVYHSH